MGASRLMVRTYSAMPHLNGNLMVAVDLETTGDRPGYHEPVQIALVPLNSDLRPLAGVRPFYTNIKPLFKERADRKATNVHGLDLDELVINAPSPDTVVARMIHWFEQLDLPFEKNLVPLAHNWAFESGFLKAWLGTGLTQKIFHFHPRDGMLLALSMNDKAVFRGEAAPFSSVSLVSLAKHFNITNARSHDAYHDCVTEAEVYRCLLLKDI